MGIMMKAKAKMKGKKVAIEGNTQWELEKVASSNKGKMKKKRKSLMSTR